jgi:hypothetical protein
MPPQARRFEASRPGKIDIAAGAMITATFSLGGEPGGLTGAARDLILAGDNATDKQKWAKVCPRGGRGGHVGCHAGHAWRVKGPPPHVRLALPPQAAKAYLAALRA